MIHLKAIYFHKQKLEYVGIFLLVMLCASGCKSSPEKIEKEFEDAIGVDIPSKFEIKRNEILVTIDLSIEYEIEFESKQFEDLVKQLDLIIQMFPEFRRLTYSYLD